MSELATPADLARELGITHKRVRDFLRAEYGKLTPPTTRWELNSEQEAKVRLNFRDKR
ncbi:hypothetical protein QMG83_10405 [Salinibacterium sp. G-O1]|uniref:hypothetical protein n=1 Tax=Salinibacterium sp. G-O1 TaxID=3046208 RepID=UPI0024B8A054|nr:hypothetical protein [Salinibacterium sp. G-O1]MDJ0335633.1 hypothetical protein [Salinibacterium sp. G-O1]